MIPIRVRAAVMTAFALTAVIAIAQADDKTQTIDAGGLKFAAPASWKSTPPKSQMRRAQLAVKPVEGDKEAAELVVFAFPGGAGGVDANVKRWAGQFQDAQGNPPTPKTEMRKGKNVDVTFVQISGHYVAPVQPGGDEKNDKPNSMLLGAIILTDEVGYYLKMTGPEKTMKSAAKDFDALIKSIEAAK